MQQGDGRGTCNGGDGCSETGGDPKAQDMSDVIKGEFATEPLLDQPSREDSVTGIAEALEYRRPNAPIAQDVGRDGGSNHTDHNGGTHAATQRDKNTDGDA
jgi:hypothetical protein